MATTLVKNTETKASPITSLVVGQKQAFYAQSLDVEARLEALGKLRRSIEAYEQRIFEALAKDFSKSAFESYATEVAIVLEEIDFLSKHLAQWAKPQKVKGSLINFPSSNYLYPSPLGVVLIIGAWNYPFQLTIAPLVGALAAGNRAVLKPSELAPATSALIKEMIQGSFEPSYVAVVEGGVPETQALLQEPWDKIFFTGSPAVGKIVMRAAAEQLIPVTLELGGKSPCIVDKSADIDLSAKRIVWGKFLNGGQTCVAPDYVVVHEEVKALLVLKMSKYITEFYGPEPAKSEDFPRIINERHFERLKAYLDEGVAVCGGRCDAAQRYIAPTILDQVSWQDQVMQEEIFGPVLPVLTYSEEAELIAHIRKLPKALSLYVFSENQAFQDKMLNALDFGGAAVNDTISHFINPYLPFGGVGSSGMGAYHGKASFDTFTHYKSVLKKATWLDIPLRYPPYKGKMELLRQAFKWMA
jgi:aldehyde dehydrogenase (NAD+)